MITPSSEQELSQALAERRRLRTVALRVCRPHERAFLRQLPESGYSPYRAGIVLGISSRTVWKLQNRPRVRRVIELFLQDALDQIGVSHASLVADLHEIKQRCMQHSQVLDAKGNPVLVPLKDGSVAAAYVFDAKGAVSAIKELIDLNKFAPPKRIELTTKDGNALPAPVFHISFEDGGPGDDGIEVSGKFGSDIPSGSAVN